MPKGIGGSFRVLELIMTQKNRLLLLVVVLLIIIAGAFLLLDFRLSRQTMAVNAQTERYSANVDQTHPLPAAQDLDLYVVAPEALEEDLTAALLAELAQNPYAGRITVKEEPLQAASNAVLVVRVAGSPGSVWTPFYTRAVLEGQVAYASDGAVDWMEPGTVVLEAPDPPQPMMKVRGTQEFRGTGYGLISRPGYHRYLAGELASQINTLLETQLSGAGLLPAGSETLHLASAAAGRAPACCCRL
jgi:hypothetical protein